MGDPSTSISPEQLDRLIGTEHAPIVIDVRRRTAFEAADRIIATAVWRDHREAAKWAACLSPHHDVVVYCAHGHEVGQAAAAVLRAQGVRARFLAGGFDSFREFGGVTIRKGVLPDAAAGGPSRWVTRERPKIDRIACPWLIRRFIDRHAVIHYVSSELVEPVGEEIGAIPFDIPDVPFSHHGELCSFDAFLEAFGITDPALGRMAAIVRGADTARLELAPQAAGLLAVSLGLSALYSDDVEMLERGMIVYDALFAWCRHAADEVHGWPPAAAMPRAGNP